jgi:hypothetical protein
LKLALFESILQGYSTNDPQKRRRVLGQIHIMQILDADRSVLATQDNRRPSAETGAHDIA